MGVSGIFPEEARSCLDPAMIFASGGPAPGFPPEFPASRCGRRIARDGTL